MGNCSAESSKRQEYVDIPNLEYRKDVKHHLYIPRNIPEHELVKHLLYSERNSGITCNGQTPTYSKFTPTGLKGLIHTPYLPKDAAPFGSRTHLAHRRSLANPLRTPWRRPRPFPRVGHRCEEVTSTSTKRSPLVSACVINNGETSLASSRHFAQKVGQLFCCHMAQSVLS